MEENFSNKDFIIPIKGLSAGEHNYEFRLDGSFFKDYGSPFIKDADLLVEILLEKGSGWMRINAHFTGNVTVECDRCLEDLVLPVYFDAPLQVKFSKEHLSEDDSGDEYIIMDPSDGELDLSQFLYDYVSINLPLQKVHKEGECNKEMIAKLREYNATTTEDVDTNIDSPFGNLKEILDKSGK